MNDLNLAARIAIWVTVAVFAAGGIALGYVTVFGPRFADQQRERFERSKMHRDAVVQDLTDRCAELALATEPQKRWAITAVIAQRAATEDLDKLQMAAPVRSCVENALNEYTGGK